MSDWVSGKDVDWTGWAECRDNDGYIAEVYVNNLTADASFFRAGDGWTPLDNYMFRRPPEDLLTKVREKLQEKLTERPGCIEGVSWKICGNDENGFYDGTASPIQVFGGITELEAYLNKPETKRFGWSEGVRGHGEPHEHDLLPGQSYSTNVGEFTVTVKRKEYP